MKASVNAICVGRPQKFRGEEKSAFIKSPATGPLQIRILGIEGDEQADPINHGGIDMAVHHYPTDHYAWWEERLEEHPLLANTPAFGENLVVAGMTEADVHIGDQFRLGSALLELSQPRQPCWKIEHRFDRKGMVKAIMKQHNCGWYYRVLEEGEAKAGDTLERLATGHEDWSVKRLFSKLYDKGDQASLDELREIAGLEKLCTLWRTKVQEAVDQIEAN
ncbi:MAG: MOSC domain-containing protein [Erythrobacter sp.]